MKKRKRGVDVHSLKDYFGLQTLMVGLIVFVLAIMQYFVTTEPWVVPVVTPLTGVAIAFIILFGRRVYFPVCMGVFLGEMVYLFLANDTIHMFYVPAASLIAVAILFGQAEFARRFFHKGALLRHSETPDRNTLLILLLVGGGVGLLSAAGFIVRLSLWDAGLVTAPLFFVLWYTHALSLLIFLPLVLLSLQEQDRRIRERDRRAYGKVAVFLGLFVIVLLVGVYLPETAFLRRQFYLYILFFLGGALFLGYRGILALVILFLTITRIFFVESEGRMFIEEMTTLFSFTIVGLVLALLLKRFKDLRNERNRALAETTRDLDNMIGYIRGFFSLSRELFGRNHPFKAIARETFDIAERLFTPDAAYGYFDNEGTIEMLCAKGHPVKRVPFLYELHDAAAIRQKRVLFYPDTHLALKKRYGESYLYHHKEEKAFMRALLVFCLRPKRYFLVGLDFGENAPYKDIDTQRMREFTDLLNKLFTKNYLTTRKVEIKDDIILTLVRALELYDRQIKGHSEDVAEIATKIGEEMVFPDDALRDLHYAGLLHDVGKLGIAADILNKKGELTEGEYETVKEHVRMSHKSFVGVEELENIREAIWNHHERYDGKGYPEGLKGEEIPLTGRILAVADALSTMPAERSYGKRRDKAESIEEIRRNRGSQFCPKAADIAVRLLEEGVFDHLFA